VRVGISPFGIWRPGVPKGTTANIDAYEHLAADSRKWLRNGWCDYLSPQLYWRINSPQSFSRLLTWWRSQGRRPVWPGIAAARVKSSEDPGRPASEIINQTKLARSIGRNYAGHVFWSLKSLLKNRGGVSTALTRSLYQEAALVPPMPWLNKTPPASPTVKAQAGRGGVTVSWSKVPGCGKYAIQARYGKRWSLMTVSPGNSLSLSGKPDAVAVSSVNRYGTTSRPAVLSKR